MFGLILKSDVLGRPKERVGWHPSTPSTCPLIDVDSVLGSGSSDVRSTGSRENDPGPRRRATSRLRGIRNQRKVRLPLNRFKQRSDILCLPVMTGTPGPFRRG
jgi:hypothetical protein